MAANQSAALGDLLYGARAIAELLFGTADEEARRRVYSMSDAGAISTFRLEGALCSRRSLIVADVEEATRKSREAVRKRKAAAASNAEAAPAG